MQRRRAVESKKFSLNVWKKLFPVMKPHKKRFIAVCIIMILTAVIDISFPLFQRYAMDNFILKETIDGIFAFTLIYVAVIVLQGIAVVVFTRMSMKMEMIVARDLKNDLFLKLQKLPLSYYNQTAVGYIISRIMSDTNKIGLIIGWGLIDMFWAAAYILGVFIAMFALHATFALLVAAIVPIIFLITFFFQKRILAANREVRHINAEVTAAYNEGITGSKTSKTLVIEDKNTEGFRKTTEKMYKYSVKATMLSAIFIPIVVFFSSSAVAIVLVQGGYMAIEDFSNFTLVSVFISYATSMFDPLQQIARIIADMVATQVNIDRVYSLLDEEETIKDSDEVIEKYGDNLNPKKENWEPIKGDIDFVNISFKYPDGEEYVLRDFDLKIPAGTNVAIVGETGAGKSTLVNLACRFFEPTTGEILIDGKNYKERSQLWLHSSIGYVLQSPHLFSGSIADNIKYGKLDATREEIEKACKLTYCHDIIMRMEKGYDTEVGEGGERLSAGERQLISFARALIANPAIFVLDEATSSVDTETEALIQKAIKHILSGRTSFLIAHRLSTIREADLILVVVDGKIIEQGNHNELIAKGGHYSELCRDMAIEENMK